MQLIGTTLYNFKFGTVSNQNIILVIEKNEIDNRYILDFFFRLKTFVRLNEL